MTSVFQGPADPPQSDLGEEHSDRTVLQHNLVETRQAQDGRQYASTLLAEEISVSMGDRVQHHSRFFLEAAAKHRTGVMASLAARYQASSGGAVAMRAFPNNDKLHRIQLPHPTCKGRFHVE